MSFLGLADVVVRIRWTRFRSSRKPIFYTRGRAQSWWLCAWLGILSLGLWEGTLLRAASVPAGFAETPVPGNWSDAVGIYFEANGRQYIWERTGRVWFQDNAQTNYTLLLDISDEVGAWQDHGMLGFALDPNFRANGYFYLLYVVDRYHLFNFGSPGYNPASNQYDEATIGRLTRYTCNAADGFRSVLPASRLVLIGETRQTGIPIVSYSHGVGSLVFGEDGTLLVSTGDGSVANGVDPGGGGYAAQALADGIIRSKEDVGAFRAQLVDCLNGKVLRLDPATGNGVPSNPYYDAANPRSAQSRVWALGLRNPFRMSLKAGSGSHVPADGNPGVLYIGNAGWNSWEALFVATQSGLNFGWPIYEGFDPNTSYDLSVANQDAPNPLYPAAGCSQYFAFRDLLKEDTLAAAGQPPFANPCNSGQFIPGSIPQYLHTRPILDWNHLSAITRTPTYDASGRATATSVGAGSPVSGTAFAGNCAVGGTWYTGTNFPAAYQNHYFFADWGQGVIKTLSMDAHDKPVALGDFATGAGAVVCLAQHPQDGSLYYISYNFAAATLRKVNYTGNRSPLVVASADRYFGPSPLFVQFSSAGSMDPDGGPLTYSWNFGDGSAVSTLANPSHTFTAPPGVPTQFVVTLTVTDVGGLPAQTTIIVAANDTPPNVTITSPVNGTLYSPNNPTSVNLTATVSDAESSNGQLIFQWQTLLHHNDHDHGGPPDTNQTTTAVLSPTGCDGINLYYTRIRLTVTDPTGLATVREVTLFPDCGPNPPPTISSIANQTASQSRATLPLAFTIGDTGISPANLQLAGSSSDPVLVPANNIVFGGEGANRTVTVMPAEGQLGNATITVSVSDGPNQTSTSFNLNVLASAPASLPGFVTEAHSATDGSGAAFNGSTLTLPVSGADTLIIAAWHSEFDGGAPDGWRVEDQGIPGTLLVDTNGYTGGDGNRRFRIYYWANPPPGPNRILVTNDLTVDPNELAVSAILLTNVLRTAPIGAVGIDVSTTARSAESETVPATNSDLVVHVIADALFVQGTLGSGETSRSVANDGLHTADGDASLWISTKPANTPTTTVSSSGWAKRVLNGVAIVVHGNSSTAPGISAIPNQTTPLNTPTPPISFTISDPDTPLANLSLSGSSSNPTLAPNANIVFGGSGANRTVTVTPAAGQSGTTTITVTVSDGTSSASSSFVLTVIPPTSPGLVAAYSFNEGSGTTVADLSGNGNGGSLSSTTTWNPAGKYGSALSFSGTAARVTIADAPSLRLTNAMTLEAWVNPTTVSSAWRDVIYKGNDIYYLMATTSNGSGRPAVGGTVNAVNVNLYGTALLAVNTWSHLAGTYDGTTLRLYVNGLQVSTLTQPGLIQTSTNPLQIGGDSIFGQTFQGLIDEVRVYNRALSVAEIQTDMNTAIGAAQNTAPTISAVSIQTVNEDTSTAAIAFTVGDAESSPASLVVSGSSSNPTLVPNANIVFGGSGANRTVTVTPAAGQTGTATLTVTVSDGTNSANTSFVLTVTPLVNTAPIISAVSNQTINEDTSTAAIAFTVGDAESSPASLVVSGSSSNPTLVPNANMIFGGSGANRTVTVLPATNQNGTATLTLTVSDGALTTSTSFVLTVTPVNDVPTITSLANQTIPANTSTAPLSFTVADVETAAGNLSVSGSSSNLTLVPNANIVFGGSGANRTVTVTPASGQSGTATITVTVSDGTSSASSSFVLTVIPPTSPGLVAAYSFNEGSGTTVADLSGNGNGGSLSSTTTWNPAGKYGSALSFSGTTARVTIADAPSLRLTNAMTLEAWVNPTTVSSAWRDLIYKGNDIYYLMATTSNGSGRPAVGGTVNAVNVNLYGTALLAVNTWSHLAGTYDGTTLRLYVNGLQVSTLTQPGLIQTSTNPLQIGGDSIFGQTFQGLIDEVRVYNRALSVAEIQTDMNTAIGAAQNTAPTISAVSIQTVNEDTSTAAIAFTVGDAETSPASLVVSGSSSNPTLVPNANMIFGGSGANRTVTVLPATNQNGTATLTLTVSDGALTTSTSFVLTVTPVNDVPTITSLANQTIPANTSTAPLSFTVADLETAAGNLSVSGSSSSLPLVPNANIVFGGSGANRTVTVTPAAGQSGTVTITVTVSDGTNSANTSFVLTVTPLVNTAPTISAVSNQTINEDTSTAAIAFTVGDAESSPASLVVSGSSSNPTLVPNANMIFGGSGANRTVTVLPATNQNGTATLTLTVSDGALTTSTSFVLTVTPVNDVPTITSLANQTIPANTSTAPLSFTVGDVETAAGSLSLSGSSSNPTLVPNANIVFGGSGANRTVTVTPAAGQSGTATITVTVSDGTNSAGASFVLTVIPPTSPGLVAAYSFNEGSGPTVADGSGRGNTGTVSNATWSTNGHYGNALVFNGSNSRVTIPDAPSLRLTNGLTLEAWVNPSVVSKSWRDVIYKGNDNYFLAATTSTGNGKPAVGGTFGGANANATWVNVLTENTWSHLAGTYDGTTLKLYLNGTQVASRGQTGLILTSANPLEIGSDTVLGQPFQGLIDEVRVYNRALSATEIQTDMNTALPTGGFSAAAETLDQPVLTIIRAAGSGGRLLWVTGAPNAAYQIEASDDLLTWISIGTVQEPTGVGSFFDLTAAEHPQRFYRAARTR